MAEELSHQEHLVLLSGPYEGIDQRIRDSVIDQEISIGDYVLTNGTLAAAVLRSVKAASGLHSRETVIASRRLARGAADL